MELAIEPWQQKRLACKIIIPLLYPAVPAQHFNFEIICDSEKGD